MRKLALLVLLLAPKASVLRVAWEAPGQLDPQKTASQAESRYVSALFEGLLVPGPQGVEVAPGMAERWETSAEGRVWTFTLRKAAWSDGEPVTAGDFVYAWRRALSPATGCEYASLFRVMKNVGAYLDSREADAILAQFDDLSKEAQEESLARLRALGRRRHAPAIRRRGGREEAREAEARPDVEEKDLGFEALEQRSLRVTLERPTPWLPDLLSFMCFVPVPQRSIEAHGEAWVKPGHIVTNGPYLFDAASPISLTFRKNPAYWDKTLSEAPGTIRVELSSDVVALEKFQQGKLDWVSREQIPSGELAQLKGAVRFDTWGTYFLRLNTAKAPFDKPELRAALAHGIDRKEIALAVGAPATERLVPSGFPGYPRVSGLGFDRAAAMEALLKETGFELSRFPRLEILTADVPRAVAAGELIREQLEKGLALHARVRPMKWPAYLRALAAGDFQIAVSGWMGDYFDPLTFLEGWTKGHPQNPSGWTDERFDALLRSAQSKVGKERLADLGAAEGILLAAAPLVPLYSSSDAFLASDRVEGLKPNLMSRFPLKYIRLKP